MPLSHVTTHDHVCATTDSRQHVCDSLESDVSGLTDDWLRGARDCKVGDLVPLLATRGGSDYPGTNTD